MAFLILNMPFWFLQRDHFIVRPILNIDLFLPLVLLAYRPRLAILLLFVFWAFDLVASHSATFHFGSTLEFLRSAEFLGETHLLSFFSSSYILLLLPFLMALAFMLLSIKRLDKKSPTWVIGLSCALFIFLVDMANGSSVFSKSGLQMFPANPARSPSFSLLLSAWQSRNNVGLSQLPAGTSAIDNVGAFEWARQNPNGSIVLVIIESMGWHKDEGIRQWLFDRLKAPSLSWNYEILQRQIRFTGATTSAELRELCSLQGSYRNMDVKAGVNCLPSKLLKLGWETEGFHGFSSNMFDRSRWWPHLGLTHRYFADTNFIAGDRRCGGGFSGFCDADVVKFALSNRIPKGSFVYILTLNSHLPLSPIPIPSDLAKKCDLAGATEEVCMITASIGIVLDAVAQAIDTTLESPPLVVVVGDHSPPFSDLNSRHQFDENTVPAILMIPAPN